jgi:hypothetical protein
MLASSFLAVTRHLSPDLSAAQIAAVVEETRMNFWKVTKGGYSCSIERVQRWIQLWNQAHPRRKVRLYVIGETDLAVKRSVR